MGFGKSLRRRAKKLAKRAKKLPGISVAEKLRKKTAAAIRDNPIAAGAIVTGATAAAGPLGGAVARYAVGVSPPVPTGSGVDFGSAPEPGSDFGVTDSNAPAAPLGGARSDSSMVWIAVAVGAAVLLLR